MTERYDRQTILPEWGENGQNLLKNSRIAVVGAGGLGCPALLYLAGAGVGQLTVIDHDIVDTSNLQRQIIYKTSEVGQLKAILAKSFLEQLNPEIKIDVHTEEITLHNVSSSLKGHDVILDAVDNFKTRHVIAKAGKNLEIPVVFGALQGFDAQLSFFAPHMGTPCYRCLYPDEPSWKPAGKNKGVPGAMPGMLGSLMALEATKYILSQQEISADLLELQKGYVLTFDGRTGESHHRKLFKNATCRLCGQS